jgi:hypothetical protein
VAHRGDQLRTKFPKLAVLMDNSETDVLAFMSFPKADRVQIAAPIRSVVGRRQLSMSPTDPRLTTHTPSAGAGS